MKTNLSARIDAELKEKLRVDAKKEKRTLSNLIEIIIQKHYERKTGRTGT